MYKRALTVLLTAHLLFLAGFLCLGQMEEIQRNLQIKVPVAADSESRMIGIASRTSSGQRVVDCNELQRNSRYHLDMAELEVLLKIVVRVVIQNFLKKPVISTVFKADE